MKPLELTIYPPVPDKPQPNTNRPVWSWEADRHLEQTLSTQKRLKDAELAAEMWRQAAWIGALGRSYAMPDRYIAFDAAFHEGPATEDEYQWTVLHRFATLPHYDEEQP